jgi:hypothetical protein
MPRYFFTPATLPANPDTATFLAQLQADIVGAYIYGGAGADGAVFILAYQ